MSENDPFSDFFKGRSENGTSNAEVTQALRTLATLCMNYYMELMEVGFTSDQAVQLTMNMQSTALASTLMKGP